MVCGFGRGGGPGGGPGGGGKKARRARIGGQHYPLLHCIMCHIACVCNTHIYSIFAIVFLCLTPQIYLPRRRTLKQV